MIIVQPYPVENINDLRPLPSYRYRLLRSIPLAGRKGRPRSRITRGEVCVRSGGPSRICRALLGSWGAARDWRN